MSTEPPALLAADWGTTNFRLFLFSADGEIIARHNANIGLKNLGVLSFEQALSSVMKEDFARPDLPILLSGMVGSRTGWKEAPYVPCPAGAKEIVAGIVDAPSDRLKVKIVPGLSADADHPGIKNVMRGEETQIFGLSQKHGDGVFVLPGTHCKWAVVHDGTIQGFSSYMTGEMFQVLKRHSILGDLMENDVDDEAAFTLGVDRAMADKSFLSLVFSARTEGLFGNIKPESLSSYLSGLLIGSEIRAESLRHGIRPVTLIGAGSLITLYKRALNHTGFTDVTEIDGDEASSAGLWALAQQGKLI
ncbi:MULTISPECIES: 2-dehydro-3-deoxygalactonokinase [Asticcacaulis]|uniref:2-dehydro-3-deoxygalactonokinase n=1 Tax=Asticcacaulis TaxID=76890 RepID=UPI001AE61E4A|nr:MULTISPECIES: 2-dehydro-3-deoxygalactonokinase [Asticcacaulis]MBP2161861.1 2-dehydro-3-deoxygalactonokinase [Asticcacaulis solisilvae]MDR6802897.1 2-dehydro-3-deoxygalactonokinase [Asticcacaulis sp. BE141]